MAPAKKANGAGAPPHDVHDTLRISENVPDFSPPPIDSNEWHNSVPTPSHIPFVPVRPWEFQHDGGADTPALLTTNESTFDTLFPPPEVAWKLPSELWSGSDFVLKSDAKSRTEPDWNHLFWLQHEQANELRVSMALEEINSQYASEFLSIWERRNHVDDGNFLWECIKLKPVADEIAASTAAGKKGKPGKGATATPVEEQSEVKISGLAQFDVRVYFAGAWRCVTVDNRVPVSKETGEVILPHFNTMTKLEWVQARSLATADTSASELNQTTSQTSNELEQHISTGELVENSTTSETRTILELWPLILSKACAKIYAMHSSGCCHTDPSFSIAHLTLGWVPEILSNQIDTEEGLYNIIAKSPWSMHDLGWDVIVAPEQNDYYFESWEEFETTLSALKESEGNELAIEQLEQAKIDAMERRRKQWRQSRRMSHNVSSKSITSCASAATKFMKKSNLLPLNILAFEEAKRLAANHVEDLLKVLSAKRDKVVRLAPCTGAPPVALLVEEHITPANRSSAYNSTTSYVGLNDDEVPNSAGLSQMERCNTKKVIWEDTDAACAMSEYTIQHHACWNILESRGSIEAMDWAIRIQGFDETSQEVVDKWVKGDSVFDALTQGGLVLDCLVDPSNVLGIHATHDDDTVPESCSASLDYHWTFDTVGPTTDAQEEKEVKETSSHRVICVPGHDYQVFVATKPPEPELVDQSEESNESNLNEQSTEAVSVEAKTDNNYVDVLFVVQADPSPQGHSKVNFTVKPFTEDTWKAVDNVFEDGDPTKSTTLIAQWSALGSESVLCKAVRLAAGVPHCVKFESGVGGSVRAFGKSKVEFLTVANAWKTFFPDTTSTIATKGEFPGVHNFGWFPVLRCTLSPPDSIASQIQAEDEEGNSPELQEKQVSRVFATLTTPDVRDEENYNIFVTNLETGETVEMNAEQSPNSVPLVPGKVLHANNGRGYSILVLARQPTGPVQDEKMVRPSRWEFAITANFDLNEFCTLVPVQQHMVSYTGTYTPNKNRLLFRELLPSVENLSLAGYSLESQQPVTGISPGIHLRIVSCSKAEQAGGELGKGDVELLRSFSHRHAALMLWTPSSAQVTLAGIEASDTEDRYLVLEGFLDDDQTSYPSNSNPCWDPVQVQLDVSEQTKSGTQLDIEENEVKDLETKEPVVLEPENTSCCWRLRVFGAEQINLNRDTTWELAKEKVMEMWAQNETQFVVASTGKQVERKAAALASRLRFLGFSQEAAEAYPCDPFIEAPKGSTDDEVARFQERQRLLTSLSACISPDAVAASVVSTSPKEQSIDAIQERLVKSETTTKESKAFMEQVRQIRVESQAVRADELENLSAQLSEWYNSELVQSFNDHVENISKWVQSVSDELADVLEAPAGTNKSKTKRKK